MEWVDTSKPSRQRTLYYSYGYTETALQGWVQLDVQVQQADEELLVSLRRGPPLQCRHECSQDLVLVPVPPNLRNAAGPNHLLLGSNRCRFLGLFPSRTAGHILPADLVYCAQHRRLVPRYPTSLVLFLGHESGNRHTHLLHSSTFGLEAPTAD